MGYMFKYALQYAQLFNADISGWDVSSVTNMRSMFKNAWLFNTDISGWDVSSVTRMDYMFYTTKLFDRDLSGLDVSSVTMMSAMFADTYSFSHELCWDVGSKDTSAMFQRTLSGKIGCPTTTARTTTAPTTIISTMPTPAPTLPNLLTSRQVNGASKINLVKRCIFLECYSRHNV